MLNLLIVGAFYCQVLPGLEPDNFSGQMMTVDGGGLFCSIFNKNL